MIFLYYFPHLTRLVFASLSTDGFTSVSRLLIISIHNIIKLCLTSSLKNDSNFPSLRFLFPMRIQRAHFLLLSLKNKTASFTS